MKLNNFLKSGSLCGAEVNNVSDVRGGDAYLFVYPDVSFLYDSGYGFSAESTYENIRRILGERELDYVLLSHSHYDHALGSATLRKHYPNVTVVGEAHCAKVLEKPGARATMERLDKAASQFHGSEEVFTDMDWLHVDRIVGDGEHLMLGEHEVEIIALPGHTRDSIGYYFPKEKLMLGTETLGITVGDNLVIPNFLVGYRMTLNSLKKAEKYDIEAYMVPHCGVLTGTQVSTFFQDSYRCHIEGKDLIVKTYRNGGTLDDIIDAFKAKFFNEEVAKVYPPAAFSENIHIEIPMVLKEEEVLKTRDELSKEEFDNMMAIGLAQAKADRSIPAEEAFSNLENQLENKSGKC